MKYQILESQVAAEAALDGIYVIRTGLPKKQMSAPEAVRSYKALTQVEPGVPLLENCGLEDTTDPSPTREPRPCAYLSVHAELLPRVAHDRGLAADTLRR